MVSADLLRAGVVFLIPLLVLQHYLGLGIIWLYLLVAVSSAITQFFDPANESVLPEIASDEELAAANSLMSISSFGSTAIGFAASGLIAATLPIEWAFWIDAVSFLFSAACIAFVHIGHVPPEEDTSVAIVWRNLKAGASYLFSTPILRSLFMVSAPVYLSFGLWNTLLLPFALRALHATTFEYGLQEGLTSVGFVVGSLVMANVADRWREGQWLAIGFFLMGVAGVAYGLASNIWVAIVLVMLSGLFNAPAGIGRRLVIQRNTPREFRGRVNSAFFVSRDVVFLVGMGLAGLADVIEIRVLVVGGSLILVLAGLWTTVLPGLGQPAAEWRRAMRLLRAAPSAPGLSAARPATLADFDLLVGVLPIFGQLGDRERTNLIAQARVSEASEGARVVTAGETGDTAYFVLSGKTVAGIADEQGEYRALSSMEAGDFFGEIAALYGSTRAREKRAGACLASPRPGSSWQDGNRSGDRAMAPAQRQIATDLVLGALAGSVATMVVQPSGSMSPSRLSRSSGWAASFSTSVRALIMTTWWKATPPLGTSTNTGSRPWSSGCSKTSSGSSSPKMLTNLR